MIRPDTQRQRPNLESRAARIQRRRERGDVSQLQDGLDAYRIETRYGGSQIAKAASLANVARSTLYERRAVWAFYWGNSKDGEQYSAWRTLRRFPHLTYTHLRDAMELEDLDDALAAFVAAADGDDRFPDLNKNLPMTAEAFRLYIGYLVGKSGPPAPLADVQGAAGEAVAEFLRKLQQIEGWRDKRIRVVAQEVK